MLSDASTCSLELIEDELRRLTAACLGKNSLFNQAVFIKDLF